MNAADLAQSSAPSGPTRATRLAAATTLLFAGLTVAILRRLTVVQGVDDHIHGWVIANR